MTHKVTKPIALDESFRTTEQNPQNIADVLANKLDAIKSAIENGGSDEMEAAFECHYNVTSATDIYNAMQEKKVPFFYQNGVVAQLWKVETNKYTFRTTSTRVVEGENILDIVDYIVNGSVWSTATKTISSGSSSQQAYLAKVESSVNFDTTGLSGMQSIISVNDVPADGVYQLSIFMCITPKTVSATKSDLVFQFTGTSGTGMPNTTFHAVVDDSQTFGQQLSFSTTLNLKAGTNTLKMACGGLNTEYLVFVDNLTVAQLVNGVYHNGDNFNEVHTLTQASDFNNDDGILVDGANGGPRFMLWQTLANKVLGFIKSLSTTITAFRSGDVIPVDGPSGTAKMSKDDLLKIITDNEAPQFDPTRTSSNPYKVDELVIYEGKLKRFINSHYGAWENADAVDSLLNRYLTNYVAYLSNLATISDFDNDGAYLPLDLDTGVLKKIKIGLFAAANGQAPLFNASNDYHEGQFVSQHGCLYQFTSDHPAGAWLGTDAERIRERDIAGMVQLIQPKAFKDTCVGYGTDSSYRRFDFEVTKGVKYEVIFNELDVSDASDSITVVTCYDALENNYFNFRPKELPNRLIFTALGTTICRLYARGKNGTQLDISVGLSSDAHILDKIENGNLLEMVVKPMYPLNQGALDMSGISTNTPNRIRTDFFDIENLVYLKVPDGIDVIVYYYNENRALQKRGTWAYSGEIYEFERYKYARFVFAKTNHSSAISVQDADDLALVSSLTCYKVKVEDKNVLEFDPVDITSRLPAVESGGIISSTGATVIDNACFRSASYFFAGSFDILEFTSDTRDVQFALFLYDYDRNYLGRTEYSNTKIKVSIGSVARIKLIYRLKAADVLNSYGIPTSTIKDHVSCVAIKSEKARRCIDLQNRIFGINRLTKPQISGHRGSIVDAPENSIPSFTLAGQRGYWACESDIHKTRDGVYVMIHDDTLDRTTTGTGSVASKTYAELMQLTLTNGIGHDADQYSDDELRIPTLDQYLSICKKYGMVAFIEIKLYDDVQALQDVIAKVYEYGLQEQVVLSAGNFGILRNARYFCDFPVWRIFAEQAEYSTFFAMGGSAMAFNIQFADLDNHPAEKEIMKQMRVKGMKFAIRAVDSMESAAKSCELGMSCFNTNNLKPSDFAPID